MITMLRHSLHKVCRSDRPSTTIVLIDCKGRLHQVEYALEAIKQGSCAVGLVSKTHAVVVALKVF